MGLSICGIVGGCEALWWGNGSWVLHIASNMNIFYLGFIKIVKEVKVRGPDL